jgi:heat shock protein HtpX
MNLLRTTLLLTFLTILFLIIGQAIGGHKGMIIAFVLALIMNFGSYWFSDKIVLKMYRAQEVTPQELPEVYQIVKTLTQRAGMPMPRIYLVEDENPNAFATGRNPKHAAVAVTTGIMRLLNSEELMGVLAHELSHVRHRDTLTSAIAATIAGGIAMLANFAQLALLFGGERSQSGEGIGKVVGSLVMIIVAPIAATLLQMAVSRSREYAADEGGAHLSGKPLALASALKKLETLNQQIPSPLAESHPSTATLLIINPLSAGGLRSLFSTHPPTEERIRRLEEIASGK